MKPLQVVELPNGFVGSQDEKGNWTYKAKEQGPLVKSSPHKHQYKDKPQFPIIDSIEQTMKKDGWRFIEDIGKEIVKKLSEKK